MKDKVNVLSLDALQEEIRSIEDRLAQEGRGRIAIEDISTSNIQDASDFFPEEFFEEGSDHRRFETREAMQNIRKRFGGVI